MSLYGTDMTDGNGTTVTTDASSTIQGLGTDWLTSAAVGDLFKVIDDPVVYKIASITDDTTIVLSGDFAGPAAGGQSYVIVRDFTTRYKLPLLNRGDLDWVDIHSEGMELLDTLLRPARASVVFADSPYTHLFANDYIGVNTAGGGVTVNVISAAVAGAGYILTVKDEGGVAATGGKNITVDPDGSETVDGSASSLVINTNYGFIRIISDGTNWFKLY